MPPDETTLKDDLNAAFDAAEKEAPPVEAPPAPEPAVAAPETPIGEKPAGERPRDEKGRFQPKIGESAKEPEKKKEEPEQLKLGEPPPPAAEEKPPPTPEKPKIPAPKSFRPEMREMWDKVPRAIQDEIHRVDKEARRIASDSEAIRQNYDKFRETVAPFEPMIRAEGVEPIQAVGNLLRTAATLATGPAQTKAQIVAGLIRTYGVDIPTLDALLSGQAPPPVQQQAPQMNPAQFRDPRLDALLEQQQKRVTEQAQTLIEEVENEEFFEDVREEMADLLEVAARRGLALTAKDAYNRAVAMHPDVSKVLEQRQAAKANNGSVARSMAASSSVKGQHAAGPPAQSGGSLRDDVEAAWDKATNQR